jgi:hypothetical protein
MPEVLITLNELQHAVLEEYGTVYLHNNHFADDPFVVVTPKGYLVVMVFYADEEYGGMYESR